MRALHIILPVMATCLVLHVQGEPASEAPGLEPSPPIGQDAQIEEPCRMTWLTDFLASRDKSVPLGHITYGQFRDDPKVQAELMNEFALRYPELLADAFRSSGNMHNPRVLPLRARFSECLLRTPTLAGMKAALLAHGYTVKGIEFEKFAINKGKEDTPFHAVVWLIVDPIENGAAQPQR